MIKSRALRLKLGDNRGHKCTYTMLDLHVHEERSAVKELMRLAKEKLLDIRLIYLPKTLSELQKAKRHLETIIPKESFKASQIRALLASNKLDPFARLYYENKILNSDWPHPSERIVYASDYLKAHGILLYNKRFEKWDEDGKYVNKQLTEYHDFQKYFNDLCEEKGIDLHLGKDDKKIEHDVFLRESIKYFRAPYSDENELRFICLTQDKSLIHFDQFILRKEMGRGQISNPNFIYPSVFLKKIRPFIPIVTNDYRKAFISSLTAPSFEIEAEKQSILVQKSMTYFRNLGIDDEEIIVNCIKRELFLEEFDQSQLENNSEEYIKSEIASEVDRIKDLNLNLEKEIIKSKEEKDLLLKNIGHEKEALKNEIEKKQEAVERLVEHQKKEKTEIQSTKDAEIKSRENDIKVLEGRLIELERKAAKALAEKVEADWMFSKNKYVAELWRIERSLLRKYSRYTLLVGLITFAPILIAIALKIFEGRVELFMQAHGIDMSWIWIFLGTIQLIEIFGRSYLFDREKIKLGSRWILASLSSSKFGFIHNQKLREFESAYLRDNPRPKAE